MYTCLHAIKCRQGCGHGNGRGSALTRMLVRVPTQTHTQDAVFTLIQLNTSFSPTVVPGKCLPSHPQSFTPLPISSPSLYLPKHLHISVSQTHNQSSPWATRFFPLPHLPTPLSSPLGSPAPGWQGLLGHDGNSVTVLTPHWED